MNVLLDLFFSDPLPLDKARRERALWWRFLGWLDGSRRDLHAVFAAQVRSIPDPLGY
jgi:hypothetical protein